MQSDISDSRNIDSQTVGSFGDEWSRYNQENFQGAEWESVFTDYFEIFPFDDLPSEPEGFDMGCGSGRWARGIAHRVRRLHCIDPSIDALAVAQRGLQHFPNVVFHHAAADTVSIEANSQDFGYSLGVLHHLPDTFAGLVACTNLLKPGAPFLLYLYYSFDNRPKWYRLVWKVSEIVRKLVSQMPAWGKALIATVLALVVYFPLAAISRLVEKIGVDPSNIPLSYYRDKSIYTMRTDSRDRFGTPLEQRFTKEQIRTLMQNAGLCEIKFSEKPPYWVAVGKKCTPK